MHRDTGTVLFLLQTKVKRDNGLSCPGGGVPVEIGTGTPGRDETAPEPSTCPGPQASGRDAAGDRDTKSTSNSMVCALPSRCPGCPGQDAIGAGPIACHRMGIRHLNHCVSWIICRPEGVFPRYARRGDGLGAGDGSTGGTRSASRPCAGLGTGAELVDLHDRAAHPAGLGTGAELGPGGARAGLGIGAEVVELRDLVARWPASGRAQSRRSCATRWRPRRPRDRRRAGGAARAGGALAGLGTGGQLVELHDQVAPAPAFWTGGRAGEAARPGGAGRFAFPAEERGRQRHPPAPPTHAPSR